MLNRIELLTLAIRKKKKKKGKLNITEEHPPKWKELEEAIGSHSDCTLITLVAATY